MSLPKNVVYKSNATIKFFVPDAKLHVLPLKLENILKEKFGVNIGTFPPQLLHFMTVM